MLLESSSVFIRDLRIHARHGVSPQETSVGADFIINLRAGYNIGRAMLTDDVRDTLSYADVFGIVKREMAEPSRLLEHAAGRIARALFAAFPAITSLRLSITKVNPPMGADCAGAGVEIQLINNKTL